MTPTDDPTPVSVREWMWSIFEAACHQDETVDQMVTRHLGQPIHATRRGVAITDLASCSVCGEGRPVLRDGTLRLHYAVTGKACKGSGQKP